MCFRMRGNSGGGLDWIDQTQFCCSVRVSPCSAADGFASGVVAQHLAGRRAAGSGAAGHSGRLGLSTTSPRVVVLTPACRFGDEGVAERAAPGTLATWTPVEPDASQNAKATGHVGVCAPVVGVGVGHLHSASGVIHGSTVAGLSGCRLDETRRPIMPATWSGSAVTD